MNIQKMDNNIKRKMTDVRRKVKLVRKWQESNKHIIDFKLKDN
jgi:hypothetical protein